MDSVREDEDVDGDTGTNHRALIAHAIIRRTMLRLVGPDRFGAGSSQKPGEPPSRILRALYLLDAHSAVEGDPAGAATIAAAAFAHGKMMHERIERPGYYWRRGGLAALLRRATPRGARVLRRAAENWTGEPLFNPIGLRRGVAAWLALAERLAGEAAKLPEAVRTDLAPLIAGCRLEGVAVGIRRLALDLLAQGGAETLNGLGALKPDPGGLQDWIGPDPVLVESDEEALDRQVEALHEALAAIVIHGREPPQIITALGWATLAGTLLNLLPRIQTRTDLLRPKAPRGVLEDKAADQALKVLIALVAKRDRRVDEDEGEPQDIFLPYMDVDAERWRQALAALRTLDATAGLWVETIENEQAPLERRTTDAGRPILILPDRREFTLAPWCVNRANLQGDSFSPETRGHGTQRIFRFSTVSSGGTPLSVDVVSTQFAKTAFGDSVERVTVAVRDQGPPLTPSPRRQSSAAADNGDNEFAVMNTAPNDADLAPSGDVVPPHRQAAEKTEIPAEPSSHGTHSGEGENIRTIARERESSWRKRALAPGMHRVALLQWDVCDTYHFPEEHDGLVTWDDTRKAFVPPRNPKPGERLDLSGRKEISVQEFRRRKILDAAIEACAAFKVEGLVLPEYSVRPETVNWLARRIEQQDHPQAIWAGTFRVPSGQTLALDVRTQKYRHGNASRKGTIGENPDFAAVISCVYRVPADSRGFERPSGSSSTVLIQDRLKRHPSVAAGELIRPLGRDWEPLFADTFWGHMHLQTFTAELVCSEIFLHASSANIPGAVAAAERLQEKLGVIGNESRESIRKEIEDFSRYTSFQEWSEEDKDRRRQLQRTVMIIPAMTSRSADYHIFGQNHHLASRLITVFVNAVCGSDGNGESCFIGLDAWKEMEVKDSPYGDVGPGIFHFQRDRFGPLGTKEAAMVIADIAPIHSTDHKPRPHFQPRPLHLVAHLPLIFATKLRKGAGARERGDHPVGHRAVRHEAIHAEERTTTFVAAILEAWHAAIDKCRDGLFGHQDVTRVLEILERFADDPQWLIKRREALQKRSHLFPYRAVPPPALADWIFVDDAWPIDPVTLERFADSERWTDDDPWLEFPELSKDDNPGT